MAFELNIQAVVAGFGVLTLLFLRLQSKNYTEAELKFNLRILRSNLHVLRATSQTPPNSLLEAFEALIDSWQHGAEQRGRFMNLLLFSTLNRISGVKPRTIFSLEYEKFINKVSDEKIKTEICELRDQFAAAVFSYLYKTSLVLLLTLIVTAVIFSIHRIWQRQWSKIGGLRAILANSRRAYFKGTLEDADYETELRTGTTNIRIPA